MKPIEGQTLLSIYQYFPTDCLRMAKKSTGMMNLFIENISEKVRKGIMDFDLESSSLEINNQAQPLFTLTAEEVEEILPAIITEAGRLGQKIIENPEIIKSPFEEYGWIAVRQVNLSKILTRIKQWQDENK